MNKKVIERILKNLLENETYTIEKEETEILLNYIADLQRKEYNNSKAVEYITSEETINMFNSINGREKWLKINHKLLNILEKGE